MSHTVYALQGVLCAAVTSAAPHHVGAVVQLRQLWPKLVIIVHEAEPQSFGPLVPSNFILPLHSPSGEVWEAWGGARTSIPEIVKQVAYFHLPGVSPGALAFLHKPSAAIFVGDTVTTQV